ncbi:MAG: UDP-N-acetylmuramoyl-L-alanyl-D-glutamate--2,6-diaminopimelate ligase, partial [Syntrophomonadaceae bacterium]|nr:UDP-N-acetylmuramoyl-L-alanyl-D-glutamate--2,6-diaminopimelate ligase [Syntrophomonadaceae bacterium]
DGHLYIEQAIKNGAIAILVEDEVDINSEVTVIRNSDTRKALAQIAANYYGSPSKNLRLIGVTGTNGKTSITHLIKAILEESGKKVGIMGTLYAKIGDREKNLNHTTPEALEIEEFMSAAIDEKTDYVVMEVSSHALDLHRVDEIDFNVAIFSNLSQDHLDYHQNMEQYRAAKLKLFKMINSEENNFSLVNIDDSNAEYFINHANGNVLTYGIEESADVRAENINISLKGTSFVVKYQGLEFKVNMKLIGMFSVYNALAAIAFALKENVDPKIIKKALEKVSGVPGRFEQIDCGQEFSVIVDYAHTPDGLENILKTTKQIVENRIITVFGCGGDRDRTKRPLMGEIAAKYSDFCIVTSDNPRSEEPQAIIDDIVPGLNKVKDSRYAIIVDRYEAIRHALYLAKKGDVVIIAGKGHENYQIIGDKVLDFDDRKVAREILRSTK